MKKLNQYILEKFKISKNTKIQNSDCKILQDFFCSLDKKTLPFFEEYLPINSNDSFTIYFPYKHQLGKFREQINDNDFVERVCKSCDITEFNSIIKKILNTTKSDLGRIDYDNHQVYGNHFSSSTTPYRQLRIYKGNTNNGLLIENYSYWCAIIKN